MEEREIDLLDMIADILSHWRGLLAALIIGAILMGGFSYVKSYRNVQRIQSVEQEVLNRQSVDNQIEQLEQEKTAIEQQVKLQMQDAAYGTAPGYKVSWVSSESKRVDSQRLKKEQPDIFNRYSKNVSSRRFTIIHAA